MKISKRTREDAALICSAIASSEFEDELSEYAIAKLLGASEASAVLASRASWSPDIHYDHVVAVEDEQCFRYLFADAEALLMTGWTP